MSTSSPLKNRPRGENGSFAPALRCRILDEPAGLPPVRRLDLGRNLSFSLARLFFTGLLRLGDLPTIARQVHVACRFRCSTAAAGAIGKDAALAL